MIGSAVRAVLPVLVAALLFSCAVSTPPSPQLMQQQPPPLPLLRYARLLAVFAECVSPMGLRRELPQAMPEPPAEALYGLAPLSDAGLVMHGFAHWLAVERSTELVYIVQRGGILGAETVFGPFQATDGCRGSPTIEPARISFGGDAR